VQVFVLFSRRVCIPAIEQLARDRCLMAQGWRSLIKSKRAGGREFEFRVRNPKQTPVGPAKPPAERVRRAAHAPAVFGHVRARSWPMSHCQRDALVTGPPSPPKPGAASSMKAPTFQQPLVSLCLLHIFAFRTSTRFPLSPSSKTAAIFFFARFCRPKLISSSKFIGFQVIAD